MEGLTSDMLLRLNNAELYAVALINGKHKGYFLEETEVSEADFTAKLKEYVNLKMGEK